MDPLDEDLALPRLDADLEGNAPTAAGMDAGMDAGREAGAGRVLPACSRARGRRGQGCRRMVGLPSGGAPPCSLATRTRPTGC